MRVAVLLFSVAVVTIVSATLALPVYCDPELIIAERWTIDLGAFPNGAAAVGGQGFEVMRDTDQPLLVKSEGSFALLDPQDGTIIRQERAGGPRFLGPRAVIPKTNAATWEIRDYTGAIMGSIPADGNVHLTAQMIYQFSADGSLVRSFNLAGTLSQSFFSALPMTAFGTSVDGRRALFGTMDGRLALLTEAGVSTAQIADHSRPIVYAAHVFDDYPMVFLLVGSRPQTAVLVFEPDLEDSGDRGLQFFREFEIPDAETVRWAARVWRLKPDSVGIQLAKRVLVWDLTEDLIVLIRLDPPGEVRDLIASQYVGFVAVSRTETLKSISLLDRLGRPLGSGTVAVSTHVTLSEETIVLNDNGRAALYELGYEDSF